VLCKFLRGAFDEPEREWSEMLYEVTGARVDVASLGARVCVLRRLFNQRAGWRPEDDRLPRRLVAETLGGGRLERRIARYYRERGCSEDGFVTRETLRAHGLEAL
jgi:aldehyde:ferredoxin oxidoreductase